MSTEKKPQPGVSKEQLFEAEQGLIRLLYAKRFSREWIERQVPEAMAQAQTDLAARIAAGREDDTVGLLVVIAYRRALKALRAEKTKPRTVPVDEVFDLTDEYQRTPEQIVMDTDRQARLLQAMRRLPKPDRELLGLVYYGELDVKAAGHRLGLSSSTADRRHKEALGKLRALVGERSLLGADVAAPALIASNYSLPNRGLHHWLEAAVDRVRDLTGWVLQRSAPIAETGSAVGMSGAGRTTAGVCGIAVAACMAAMTSGVVGPGVSVFHPSGSGSPSHERTHRRVRAASAPEQTEILNTAPNSPPPTFGSGRLRPNATNISHRGGGSRGTPGAAKPTSREAPPEERAGTQTTEEFGVEGGSRDTLSQPTESSSTTAPPPPAPAKAAPDPAGKSESNSEFGL